MQKRQNSRAEIKVRKHATKTEPLVVLAKTLQAPKKYIKNAEHQQKIIPNGKQPANKPQNPERTPER